MTVGPEVKIGHSHVGHQVKVASGSGMTSSGMAQQLNADPLASSETEFGPFIWKLFKNKYGANSDASIHCGDFIYSLRKYRDSNHRARLVSEFAGIDVKVYLSLTQLTSLSTFDVKTKNVQICQLLG